MARTVFMLTFLCALLIFSAAGTDTGSCMQEDREKGQPEEKSEKAEKIILGMTCPERIIGFNEATKQNFETYEPSSEALAFLKGIDQPVTIEVFYGSWCSDSIREVPRFIKIMDLVKNKNLQITFIGVDRSKKQPAEKTEGKNIEFVPTFIVLRDGKEAGRIIESPKVSLEQDLADILKKK
jgi:thiol-disulfide isomerase/thioredoxin